MDKVTIIRSARRSSIGIQIMPDATVKVTAPFLVPRFMIDRLLKEKADWIKESQEKLRTHNLKKSDKEFFFLGKKYELALRQNQKNVVELADKLYVASPNEKHVKTYLESWYRQQARKIILDRVHFLGKLSDSTYNAVSLTSATTRWGSCSSQKNLNFNWKLVMAPPEVIDYVIAHELAHLTEMNHSRDFWERVRKIFPLYRQYRTWLKRHGHMLTI